MKDRRSGDIGQAIRKLRLAKGWTLSELSQQCGVPLSTLSRVELGQNALNYEKLVRLCKALEIDLQGLVARDATAPVVPSGRRSVTRAGTGDPVTFGLHGGYAQAADLLAKAFSPMVLEISGGDGPPGPMQVTGGEAYLMVLDGVVALHSALYAPLTLHAGDSVYFDGRSGFALTAEQKAGALLILTGDLPRPNRAWDA